MTTRLDHAVSPLCRCRRPRCRSAGRSLGTGAPGEQSPGTPRLNRNVPGHITALAAALSLAIYRTGLVGRWLGVVGLVAAAIFLLGSVFSVLGRTPEGGSSLVGVGLFIVWMLLLSAGLWRSAATTTAPRP